MRKRVRPLWLERLTWGEVGPGLDRSWIIEEEREIVGAEYVSCICVTGFHTCVQMHLYINDRDTHPFEVCHVAPLEVSSGFRRQSSPMGGALEF